MTDAFDLGVRDCDGKKISWRAVPVAVPQIEVAVSLETCVAPTCAVGESGVVLDAHTLSETRSCITAALLTYAWHDDLKKPSHSHKTWNFCSQSYYIHLHSQNFIARPTV